MKNNHYKTKVLSIACFWVFSLNVHAQESIPVTGGEASGSGGTVSYSVGQVSYLSNSGSNGSVSEGVQQPYEITVTSINDISGITLNMNAYPNPTKGNLWLNIEDYSGENISYHLYDYSGKLILSEPVRDSQTLISLQNFASAMYFVRVMSEGSEIKTFKIIKN